MSLMKYENIEIDDFTEKITEGGVVNTLYEDTFRGVSWNPKSVWLHYYAINDSNSSRYLVWLRNLTPARCVIFKRDCVMVGKELREKINSWL